MKTEQKIEVRVTPQQEINCTDCRKMRIAEVGIYSSKGVGVLTKSGATRKLLFIHVKLCELRNSIDGKVSSDVEEKHLNLTDDIRSEILLSEKETITEIKTGLEGDKEWQLQDSGHSKES